MTKNERVKAAEKGAQESMSRAAEKDFGNLQKFLEDNPKEGPSPEWLQVSRRVNGLGIRSVRPLCTKVIGWISDTNLNPQPFLQEARTRGLLPIQHNGGWELVSIIP